MNKFYEKIELNKVTLSFKDDLEEKFQIFFLKDSIISFRYAFLILIFLYGIFILLDNYIIKEDISIFYIIRFAIVIPIFSFVFTLSYTSYFRKIWQWLLTFSFVTGGLGIIVMLAKVPMEYSYYLGLILVIFSGYFLIKLRFIYAALAGWLMVILFNIVMLNFSDVSINLIIAYNFFFISANIIGMFAAYNIELFYRRNYWLAQNLSEKAEKLNDQNNHLDELVRIRTYELTESEKKLNILFESMSDMVVLHEFVFNDEKKAVNYIITDCNLAFTKITGIKKENAINRPADLLYQTDSPPYLNEFLEVVKKGIPKRFETFFEKMNKYFLITIVPIGNDKFATVTMDITENKIAEDKLHKQNKELEAQYEEYMQLNEVLQQTNLELEIAKTKAEESDHLKTSFLQNISHEIRTPLNGIIGFSKLLTQSELSKDEIFEFSLDVKQSADRLIELINNIIDISKIQTGQLEIISKYFSVNSLITDLYSQFLPFAEIKGLRLNYHVSLEDNLSVIIADESKINQILSNLINNAIKFTTEGYVDFGYIIHANSLQFYVKDTGIGIPEELQTKVFERFAQADSSVMRNFEGAGLGLSICKGLTDLLGGKIWVESKAGSGSTFNFTIPVDRD